MTPGAGPRPVPRATYRLQLHEGFGFADVAALAPYLASLGVSHVYLSPYLRARPGSTHGYDIVDHGALNPELGSDEDFDRMVAALRANALGQVIDLVPNHMGVGGGDNPLWLDILEWGAASDHARWFDIDWSLGGAKDRGKLLVPFLGDHYGAVLASGELRLAYDEEAGSFSVRAYGTHTLPIHPPHYDRILGGDHPTLERLGDVFAHLAPPGLAAEARRLKADLAAAVAGDAAVSSALQRRLATFSGKTGDLASWRELAALIADQHWRAAHFRVAAHDINYRRFFNVNELAGLRMELPEVFDHAHRLVLGLVDGGIVDGLRIDHIDGLLDPRAYCLRLRKAAAKPVYLVVEKILAGHERLRSDWDVEGTTGYEFAHLTTGLLVDPGGEPALTEFYEDFTGCIEEFAEVVRRAKLQIMNDEMAGELAVLARAAFRVARSHPMTADFTARLIERTLKEIVAAFPVYRTYVDAADAPGEDDRRDIDWAFARARRADPALDLGVLEFLHGLMTCDLVANPGSGYSRSEVTNVAMRVQQYSGPVMAKGVEDTAFYRYNRLLALNEVGGQPGQFGISIAAFHQANRQRAQHTPHGMLATSSHDTKRGEDARARLAVLSEMPDEWTRQVRLWSRMLRGPEGSSAGGAEAPDRNDEYAFYQMLLGSWPPELTGGDRDAAILQAFRARVEAAMIKTVREAKRHTTWARPDAVYEDAVLRFVGAALDVARPNAFLESFADFASRVAPLGVWNSLVQTVLKLTLPGVPDIYQGAEAWDFNMVDPDNRRPVDYPARSEMLERDDEGHLATLLGRWQDGAIKLRLVSRLLRFRREHRHLFDTGAYHPLAADGADADRICAFERRLGTKRVAVAVLLHPVRGRGRLDETLLGLASNGGWADLLARRAIDARNTSVAAEDLFASLPVAVLVETL